jgi:hypothetical protein
VRSAVWGVEHRAEDTFLLFAVTNRERCVVKKSARVDIAHRSSKEMPPWPIVHISKLCLHIMTIHSKNYAGNYYLVVYYIIFLAKNMTI